MLAPPVVRLLILEDSPEDAELEQHALHKAGVAFEARRVETRAALLDALASFRPSLIIADYKLPDIDGLAAVKLIRQHDQDIPIILVTGVLEDEAAVEIVKAGANDYVRKDRLARLPLALDFALTAAAARREHREAEKILVAANAEIEDLYENAPCGYHSINADAFYVRMNDTELAWLGYARDELIGKLRFPDQMTPESAAKFWANFPNLKASGEVHNSEFEMVRKDGTRFIALVSATVLYHPDGSFNRTRCVLADITVRKQMEQRLAFNLGVLEAEHEVSPDGILLVGVDGTFSTNRRFEEMWGIPPEVIVAGAGRPLLERPLVEAAADKVNDPPGFIARLQYLYGHPDKHSHEEILLKDGRVFERHGGPMTAADGAYIGRIWFFRDISDRKKIERDLEFSNLLNTTAIESSLDGILVVDENAKIIVLNKNFVKMLHMPQELIDAKADEPVLERVTAQMKDPAGFLARVRYLYEHPAETSHEEVELADGHLFDRYSATLHDGAGRYLGRVWFFRDITERRRAEVALRSSEAMLANALHIGRAAPFTYDAVTGSFTFSDGFYHLLRTTADKVGGYTMPAADYIRRFVHPDDAAYVREQLAAALRSNDPDYKGEVENRVIYGDGEVGWFAVRFVALQDANGKRTQGFGVAQDITERKRVEESVRQQETMFRALVEQGVAAVAVVSEDGTLAYVNPYYAHMLGYEQEDIVGRSLLELIPESERPAVTQKVRAQMSGQLPFAQLDSTILHKDGHLVNVLVNATAATYKNRPASIAVALDITQRRQSERALERLNRILRTVGAGNELLVRAADEAELLQGMCRIIVEVGGYSMAWIGFAEQGPMKSIKPAAVFGDERGYLDLARITWGDEQHGQGPIGITVRTGELCVSQDIAADPRMGPWQAEALKRDYRATAAFPLKNAGTVFGVMALYSGRIDAFTSDEQSLLSELSLDLAFGIRAMRDRVAREETADRLRRAMTATVRALANTVELRDPYTAGHQRNVGKLAAAMAQELGLPPDEVAGIELAGLVHDLGKIQIPAEILSKPGKLSRLEYQLIQTHAQTGYDIVKEVDFPWPIALMVLQHHERLDGSGYPQGLKDGEIRLDARIIAVADVVEAMTSRRPYRAALGLDAALAEIEQGRGRLYDPLAVDACLRLFRQKGFTFP